MSWAILAFTVFDLGQGSRSLKCFGTICPPKHSNNKAFRRFRDVILTSRVFKLESSNKDQMIATYKDYLLIYVTSGIYFRLGRFIG